MREIKDLSKMKNTDALASGKKWFKEAQFGGMCHWGLYTLLAGEWNGKKPWHPYSEWIQNVMRIPNKQYGALAKAFNPIMFNPDEWIMRVRDAGMKYFVFTSKHHDGFAMYRTKVSKYNVVDATPFKRDIVGEIAESCRKYGVKFGLYYSQDFDWNDPDGGGYTSLDKKHTDLGGQVRNRSNYWDWPDSSKKDFSRYFERKCKPQVKEILTQYGDLCLIWFDTPHTISAEQSRQLRDMVRKYQPSCLLNSRIGNGMGDYSTPGDNELFSKTDPTKLYETVGTMNDSWGFYPADKNWKSLEKILSIREKCKEKGVNYLLNFGPDPLGRIPAPAVSLFEGLAKEEAKKI
jgi:alpha-L-fucosidase